MVDSTHGVSLLGDMLEEPFLAKGVPVGGEVGSRLMTNLRRTMHNLEDRFPKILRHRNVVNVLRAEDRKYFIVVWWYTDLNRASGCGESAYFWTEHLGIVEVTEEIAMMVVDAYTRILADERERIAEEQRGRKKTATMSGIIQKQKLDDAHVKGRRQITLYAHKLDELSILNARQTALLSEGFNPDDIEGFLQTLQP